MIPRSDSVLDADSLVLGSEGSFGQIINVGPYQQDLLISHGDYQYAAWYHNGPNDENIFVSRRHLLGTTWETIDTGYTLENGDGAPIPAPAPANVGTRTTRSRWASRGTGVSTWRTTTTSMNSAT